MCVVNQNRQGNPFQKYSSYQEAGLTRRYMVAPNLQTYIAESMNMKYLNTNLEDMNFNIQESMKRGENVIPEQIVRSTNDANNAINNNNKVTTTGVIDVEENGVNLPDPKYAAGAAIVFLIVSTIQQLSLGDVFDDEAKASVDASAARRMSKRNRSFFKRPRGEE